MAERCECGCGQVPPIATRTRNDRGYRAGERLRFSHGHGGRRPADQLPACNLDTLDACAGVCGGKIHRGKGACACREQHPALDAHGMCKPCLRAAREASEIDPRRPKGHLRDTLLDAWVDLAEIGVTFQAFGESGRCTSFPAWERMFLRARASGDPRAVRIDLGETFDA